MSSYHISYRRGLMGQILFSCSRLPMKRSEKFGQGKQGKQQCWLIRLPTKFIGRLIQSEESFMIDELCYFFQMYYQTQFSIFSFLMRFMRFMRFIRKERLNYMYSFMSDNSLLREMNKEKIVPAVLDFIQQSFAKDQKIKLMEAQLEKLNLVHSLDTKNYVVASQIKSIHSNRSAHQLIHKERVSQMLEQNRLQKLHGKNLVLELQNNGGLYRKPQICEKISRILRILERKYEEKLIEKRKIQCDSLKEEKMKELKSDLVFIKNLQTEMKGLKEERQPRLSGDWRKGRISLARKSSWRKQMKNDKKIEARFSWEERIKRSGNC